MPPATEPFSDHCRFSRNQGSCSSAVNNVLTPVNQVIGSSVITRCRFDNGRGLGTRMLRPPIAKKIIRFAVNAKM